MKLNDAEGEAAQTQTWIEFSVRCGYLKAETGRGLYAAYNRIIGKLVNMIRNPAPTVPLLPCSPPPHPPCRP